MGFVVVKVQRKLLKTLTLRRGKHFRSIHFQFCFSIVDGGDDMLKKSHAYNPVNLGSHFFSKRKILFVQKQ